VPRGKPLKLRRALCLVVGLSSTACGDLIPDVDIPSVPVGGDRDARVTGGGTLDGGGSADGGTPGVAPARMARMVSVAPTYVLAGDPYRYLVKTSSKTAGLELGSDAPAGMRVRGAMVEWNPTAGQSGTHRATVRGAVSASGQVAAQEINISVAKATLRAEGDVDENAGGSVYASSPQASRLRGAGVSVGARAVSGSVKMTVSELDVAPAMPNSAGAVSAVRFGPAGQVFASPARVTIPLPKDVTHAASRLGVYVYDPVGRWRRVPMVQLDVANGLVTAKAQHFSIYAALQSSLDLDLHLDHAAAKSVCAGTLMARAQVTSPLMEIELAAVNNLSESVRASVTTGGADPSLQDLLGAPGFTGSLRAVQVFDLLEAHDSTEVLRAQRLTTSTLYVPGDGSATITHTDALGNLLGSKRYARPLAELADIALRLRGGATDVTFAGETGEQLGLAARVHLLYFPGDASLDPVSVDDLGVAAVERAAFETIGESSVGDVDCDGLLDGFDDTDDSLLAGIEASPAAVISLFRGEDTKLEARVVRGGQAGSWSLLDDAPDATLAAITGAPDARRFSANAAGRYLVSYRGTDGARKLEHIFAIDVIDRVMGNTAPRCLPSREVETGRVGEAVAVSAIASDAESATSALRIEWGLYDPTADATKLVAASTLNVRGDQALFAPLSAGNYKVGCRAFDGETYGPIGAVDLTIVEAKQNRAPVDLALTPLTANLELGRELKLQASAVDPDGDALSFSWVVDGVTIQGNPEVVGESSYLRVKADTEGVATVTISVTDGKTAPLTARAELTIGSLPVGDVDVDGDGWTVGASRLSDCNDSDPTIHPLADEKCGENVDRDCDGSVRLDDCDYDDQTVAEGDCDDANPNRKTGLVESCDGLDNDCNNQVDEAFSVGKICQVGVGQCVARGALECSADGVTTICDTLPDPGSPEICDGLDNDCDGIVDQMPVCGSDAGVPDAGVADAGVADASSGGEAGMFDAGTQTFPDAGVPVDAGGCVYQGAEICTDGKDNDCDGMLDGQDPECMQQQASADSCANVVQIELGQYYGFTFEQAQDDFASACASKLPDRIYGFTSKLDGFVTVNVSGSQTHNWSVMEGVCNPLSTQLSELTCGSNATQVAVKADSSYWLVIEGVGAGYEFHVEFSTFRG